MIGYPELTVVIGDYTNYAHYPALSRSRNAPDLYHPVNVARFLFQSRPYDFLHHENVMKPRTPEHWKGPTSRKEREKWGTRRVYDAGEVGPPNSNYFLLAW